jgi:ATP-dependent Clp protease ATP-binding subunit ClpA
MVFGAKRIKNVLNPRQVGRRTDWLGHNLRKWIIGQEEAVDVVVEVYQTYLAAMNNRDRPIGSFLFMGPTGSGKTRIVEALAEALVGDARAVIKIDCAEFQHSHEISKLLGSPPGYIGHRETRPILSQESLEQYHTEQCKLGFVLFDEVEKASDALWNLLLGILDKANLMLGDNRRTNFSRAMVFMTSNLGSVEMSNLLSSSLGFTAREKKVDDIIVDRNLMGKIRDTGLRAARKKFSPEFLNRIDKLVVFQPLGTAELQKILDLELGYVQQRILTSAHGIQFIFKCTDAAKRFLLRESADMKYGARHLKRAVERHLVYSLSNLIVTEQVRAGDMVKIDAEGDELSFTKEKEGIPLYNMLASQVYPEILPAADTVRVREQAAGKRS